MTVSLSETNALNDRHIKVFVHLARGYGAENWLSNWKKGKIIGLNEQYPYGFFFAEDYGCNVKYSEDYEESFAERSIRLCVRLILGFDLVHAWHNRRTSSPPKLSGRARNHSISPFFALCAFGEGSTVLRSSPRIFGCSTCGRACLDLSVRSIAG